MSELHKLSIALQMRGGPGWMYKFRPQHTIFKTTCMVLQKRAFRLDKADEAIEISLASYNPNRQSHVLVREIAFGPDGDPTVRGVGLWFNIPEKDVTIFTQQQAKRFRWKKGPKRDERNSDNSQSKIFETRECFNMIRPDDRDAYNLVTDILKHRLQTLQAERTTNLSDRSKTSDLLKKQREELCLQFTNQKRHWNAWSWPINAGRQIVDESTPVPSIDGPFNPLISQEGTLDEDGTPDPAAGSVIQNIWDSFVTECSQDVGLGPQSGRSKRRLPIFVNLARGWPAGMNRSLPHILRSRMHLSPEEDDVSLRRQSERCWQALFLKQGGIHQSNNEWEIVRHHFDKSRSKKTLKIIQKQ